MEKSTKQYNPRSLLKMILLIPVLPLLIGVGIWYYEKTGRYISTENAYVKADIVQISAKISGTVSSVLVKNNQSVKTGDLLFKLDQELFNIAVDSAEAQYATAAASVEELKSTFRLLNTELKEAEERVKLNRLKFERQRKLQNKSIGPLAALEEAKYNLQSAIQYSAGKNEERLKVLKNLKGIPGLKPSRHPSVKHANANRRRAKNNLKYTVITAPTDGIIANISLQKGESIKAGKPVFSIVKQKNMWVEANLKETQITYLKEGQSAEVFVDAYPHLKWISTVNTIGAATGSEFSLLPPQNASGNWVKVVQRLPIILFLKPKKALPTLRPGMSVKVVIDTTYKRSTLNLIRDAWDSFLLVKASSIN